MRVAYRDSQSGLDEIVSCHAAMCQVLLCPHRGSICGPLSSELRHSTSECLPETRVHESCGMLLARMQIS